MGKRDDERLISVKKQLTIAKRALELIVHWCRSPEITAETALDQIQLQDIGKTHAMEKAK